jgi:zinc transport system permease protein
MNFINQVPFEVWIVIVGLCVAGTCSLLSTYVVLRRMALISEGVAHAGFGGLSLAIFMGYFFPIMEHVTYGYYLQQGVAAIFCIITALLIGYFAEQKRVSEDSSIGIFLVASVAIGMLLLSARVKLSGAGAVPVSAESLLFGSLLSVTWTDAVSMIVIAGLSFAAVAMLYHELLYTTLDEQMARVNGVNTRGINFLLYAMISLVIVFGIRMVGALMITALMVLPGATANMLSRRFGGVMAASLIIGIGSFALAITLCLETPLQNYPPGPIIVLTMFVVFLAVWVKQHLGRPKVQPLAAPPGQSQPPQVP